ncbi:MAG: response regulator [Terriglobia bacterium]
MRQARQSKKRTSVGLAAHPTRAAQQRLRLELGETQSFWAGVGHDVSNLLEAALGNAESLRERLCNDAEARQALDAIVGAVELAACWMKQAARKQRVDGLRAGLNGLVKELENVLRALAGSAIQVDVHFAPREVCVGADPMHAARILINLVLNARDAMPKGGRITVRIAEAGPRGLGARPASRRGLWGRVTVSDTGTGIESPPHVFHAGYSTKSEHLGIGLSTAQLLAERNGGFIEFQSAPGGGAEFSAYFPRILARTNATRTTTAAAAAWAGPMPIGAASRDAHRPSYGGEENREHQARKSKRILLVDDDPSVREILCRTLAGAGYGVEEACGAAEALDRFGSRAPGVDLLVTDVRMEPMTGRKLASAFRAKQPGIRILYISGYPEESADLTGDRASYLTKPFRPGTLLAKVREMLSGGSGSPALPSGSAGGSTRLSIANPRRSF